MVNNFRYSSTWEQFEEAVRVLKDLIDQKKAYWMAGFINDVDILIDETELELSMEVKSVIDDEIIYLMRGIMVKKDAAEEDIKRDMRLSYPDISQEELENFVISMYNKRELVKDTFDIEKLSARYESKKISINRKLSNFNYNIFTHDISKYEKVKCALINISSKKKLTQDEKEDEVSFVCDTEDIDVLIHLFQLIKTCMEEG